MPVHKRRKKLVKPALQLKIIFAFLATALLAVFLQTALLSHFLATPDGDGGRVVSDRMVEMVFTTLAVTVAVLVPASLLVGATVTHRVAGPVYRFEMFLKQVSEGTHPQPCRIRKDDELHDLCDLLNEATAPLRKAQETSEESEARQAA